LRIQRKRRRRRKTNVFLWMIPDRSPFSGAIDPIEYQKCERANRSFKTKENEHLQEGQVE